MRTVQYNIHTTIESNNAQWFWFLFKSKQARLIHVKKNNHTWREKTGLYFTEYKACLYVLKSRELHEQNRLQLKYRLSDRMDNTHVYRSERNRGSRPANHPSTSTNRNVAIIFLREILEEWKPCFPDKLKHSNDRTKDWWISDRTFKIRNDARVH